jgi:hypothetical protein
VEAYQGPMEGGTVEAGELFFGIFTTVNEGTLGIVYDTAKDALNMELIAWDYTRKVFNFWELVGTGTSTDWRFLGNSDDVLADVASINLGREKPEFGKRLRCSACHTLGGPVMKELEPPFNDWSTREQPPGLGKLKLDRDTAPLFEKPAEAKNLSRLVKQGIDRLLAERTKRTDNPLSLRQELRSLFTTMEINLATDRVPFRERLKQKAAIEIPRDFFADARLAQEKGKIEVPAALYHKQLQWLEARFAGDETPGLIETHHAFSVPIRSYMDQRTIDSLLERKFLTPELVEAVLLVDFTMPVYSRARASLMRYVPENAKNAANLREQLLKALRDAPKDDTAARELLANLEDPKEREARRREVQAYLRKVQEAATDRDAVEGWLRLAAQRRMEIERSETAQHPQGKITEPGFKVLFPGFAILSQPGKWTLDPKTGRLRK